MRGDIEGNSIAFSASELQHCKASFRFAGEDEAKTQRIHCSFTEKSCGPFLFSRRRLFSAVVFADRVIGTGHLFFSTFSFHNEVISSTQIRRESRIPSLTPTSIPAASRYAYFCSMTQCVARYG